ncbi:MAG TPA: hypothetical protein VMD74_00905 [Candidatus Methylomirabilis sp.]|nr:hypothetical protein [Candidatus Methylomirabilis sp.]
MRLLSINKVTKNLQKSKYKILIFFLLSIIFATPFYLSGLLYLSISSLLAVWLIFGLGRNGLLLSGYLLCGVSAFFLIMGKENLSENIIYVAFLYFILFILFLGMEKFSDKFFNE